MADSANSEALNRSSLEDLDALRVCFCEGWVVDVEVPPNKSSLFSSEGFLVGGADVEVGGAGVTVGLPVVEPVPSNRSLLSD